MQTLTLVPSRAVVVTQLWPDGQLPDGSQGEAQWSSPPICTHAADWGQSEEVKQAPQSWAGTLTPSNWLPVSALVPSRVPEQPITNNEQRKAAL